MCFEENYIEQIAISCEDVLVYTCVADIQAGIQGTTLGTVKSFIQ